VQCLDHWMIAIAQTELGIDQAADLVDGFGIADP
jgi:hypothetical protein